MTSAEPQLNDILCTFLRTRCCKALFCDRVEALRRIDGWNPLFSSSTSVWLTLCKDLQQKRFYIVAVPDVPNPRQIYEEEVADTLNFKKKSIVCLVVENRQLKLQLRCTGSSQCELLETSLKRLTRCLQRRTVIREREPCVIDVMKMANVATPTPNNRALLFAVIDYVIDHGGTQFLRDNWNKPATEVVWTDPIDESKIVGDSGVSFNDSSISNGSVGSSGSIEMRPLPPVPIPNTPTPININQNASPWAPPPIRGSVGFQPQDVQHGQRQFHTSDAVPGLTHPADPRFQQESAVFPGNREHHGSQFSQTQPTPNYDSRGVSNRAHQPAPTQQSPKPVLKQAPKPQVQEYQSAQFEQHQRPTNYGGRFDNRMPLPTEPVLPTPSFQAQEPPGRSLYYTSEIEMEDMERMQRQPEMRSSPLARKDSQYDSGVPSVCSTRASHPPVDLPPLLQNEFGKPERQSLLGDICKFDRTSLKLAQKVPRQPKEGDIRQQMLEKANEMRQHFDRRSYGDDDDT